MRTDKIPRFLKKLKKKHWGLVTVGVFILLEFFGVFRMLKEESFHADFSYPLEGDVSSYVEQMKRGETPVVNPIYKHEYFLLKHPLHKCLATDMKRYQPIRVVYLVKSALKHVERRNAIRQSWGFEKRFADVEIRTVFLLGQAPDDLYLQGQIEEEFRQHEDIVQGDFIDNYYNNSLKAAMGLRWASEHCSSSRFYMFVDDDYYVSTRNVLRFLRNPVNYPGYLEEDIISFNEDNQMFPPERGRHVKRIRHKRSAKLVAPPSLLLSTPTDFLVRDWRENSSKVANRTTTIDKIGDIDSDTSSFTGNGTRKTSKTAASDKAEMFQTRKLQQLADFDLPQDVRLYTGYVLSDARPHRHRSSKWFISVEEYPFDRWPPYITAGAYVLSRQGLMDMYYTSYFTKMFRFDDIWLGLIAQKAALQPLHSEEFYFDRKRYSVRGYRYVVASHGFSDPKELVRVWSQQREAGNA